MAINNFEWGASEAPAASDSIAKGDFTLRPATLGDYAFAEKLYLETTERLLRGIGSWDEALVLARFRHAFKPEEARIIRCSGMDVGWIQVSERVGAFHLRQIHIAERFRNRQFGTRLIEALIERARQSGRSVALNVIRGNRALSLYRRLGFRVVGGNKEKLHMRWDAGGRGKPVSLIR